MSPEFENLRATLDPLLRGPLHAFAEVPSTMDLAHDLAAAGTPEGTLVVAERQTKGRGRLGRTWVSPSGGLYASLILRPIRPPADVPQLSLVAGLALAEAIEETAGLHPSVKWPNDLWLDGKKVAGILAESGRRSSAECRVPSAELKSTHCLIIGLGVNVTTEPAELPETATSLKAAGAAVGLADLAAALYLRLLAWYDVWQRRGFTPVRSALRPRLALLGEVVHISAGADRLEGTAADLDELGRLVIRRDSGSMQPLEAGEVTRLE
jgi:BirA family biotin operon repressor/biotin-[acetyl-CoA-carboxylase] ligase